MGFEFRIFQAVEFIVAAHKISARNDIKALEGHVENDIGGVVVVGKLDNGGVINDDDVGRSTSVEKEDSNDVVGSGHEVVKKKETQHSSESQVV